MGLGQKHRLGRMRTRVETAKLSDFDRQATAHIPLPPADPIDIGKLADTIDTGRFSASPVTPADKVELAKLKHPSIAEKVAPKKRKSVTKKPARKAKKK